MSAALTTRSNVGRGGNILIWLTTLTLLLIGAQFARLTWTDVTV